MTLELERVIKHPSFKGIQRQNAFLPKTARLRGATDEVWPIHTRPSDKIQTILTVESSYSFGDEESFWIAVEHNNR
jgi:hypothetical protein